MFYIDICVFKNAYMVYIDCWRRTQLFTVLLKLFLLGKKSVCFSRELNEILRPVGYKSDHTIIMVLLSLYGCDIAVLVNY